MLSAIERQQLFSIVQESILHGLNLTTRIELDHQQYAPSLFAHRASFVTLKLDGLLRGCIGSVYATEPLIDNLAYNAHSAAFDDPRFLPVNQDEFPLLDIEFSILSEPETIDCRSEQDLLEQLRPGIDGLILTEGEHCATFLPTVWGQISDNSRFVYELKLKAGLEGDYWSDTLKAERYTVEHYRKK
ncbi:AmmeMemoRadiSam system protein A [Oceanicoccus sagamiensis]|uniref:AMMECR1 domain-containing protein n=1 Tax=Oceanicoccus sagamiensis TaxID=716816 RepID=A0A1X9NKN5_9GAMM|nr:AmmeMemoRadiSam system protein A [Oceanicoccus sagamiensis]ARN75999.1 hypothetical protein BST96_19010 [Oceanicoccus sagamiensis]